MTTPDLPRRFLVRRCDDGSSGVWDTVINAWRATGLDPTRAERQAADLELQFDAWGPRPVNSLRAVRPPVEVDVEKWQPAGLLDYWLRARIEESLVPRFAWYGRIRRDDGSYLWQPADSLRRSATRAVPRGGGMPPLS